MQLGGYVKYLNGLASQSKINDASCLWLFVGYCLGGKLAYLSACRIPELACAVGYYGYDSYGSSNYTSSLKVNSTSTIVSIVYGVASYNDTVELIANVMTSDNVPVNGGIVSFYVDSLFDW